MADEMRAAARAFDVIDPDGDETKFFITVHKNRGRLSYLPDARGVIGFAGGLIPVAIKVGNDGHHSLDRIGIGNRPHRRRNALILIPEVVGHGGHFLTGNSRDWSVVAIGDVCHVTARTFTVAGGERQRSTRLTK